MRFDELKNIKMVEIFIGNEKIDGELVEVDKWGKMVISIPSEMKIIPAELGKKGEIFIKKDEKKFFVSGKIFSQSSHRVIFLPETDILEEKRKNERFETPFLPVKLISQTGLFHKEVINGNILNISFSGAKVETNIPLRENINYIFETHFPIKKHKIYFFQAECKLRFSKKIRNLYINGIEFLEIKPHFFENLLIYIKVLKHEIGKDALNY